MFTIVLIVIWASIGMFIGYSLRTKEAKLLAEIKPHLQTIYYTMAGKVALVENDFASAYHKVGTILSKL